MLSNRNKQELTIPIFSYNFTFNTYKTAKNAESRVDAKKLINQLY